MDHFEDQFLTESHEPLGTSFEKAAKLFDLAGAPEGDFLHPQQPVEESIYRDDPVRHPPGVSGTTTRARCNPMRRTSGTSLRGHYSRPGIGSCRCAV